MIAAKHYEQETATDSPFPHKDKSSLRYCPHAAVVLTLALLATFLLFVRVAVLWAPGYSYQGPVGADRVFYYAYVRSLVIDRDLDLTNEIALRPPTSGLITQEEGKPLNKYPIGTPLLSLPFYILTHLAILAGNALGWTHFATDGYSAPYAFSYAFSQLLWALFGAWLMYCALLRYFDSQTSALAVAVTWLSTHALHFAAVDLMMSHTAAIFSIAWCSYESVRLREAPERWPVWFGVGVSSALVALVRYQNAVYLLVPACAAWSAVAQLWKDRKVGRILVLPAISGAGFCIMFAPQLAAWKAIFGSWVTNSYQREYSFQWLQPALRESFFDPATGLTLWLPALSVGIAGCLALAIRRRDLIAGAAGLAWLANLYVTTCWWAWKAIIHRSPFDMLFPLCLGFGFTISYCWARWPRISLAIALLLVAWNIPLAVLPGASTAAGQWGVAAWWQGLAVLLRLRQG